MKESGVPIGGEKLRELIAAAMAASDHAVTPYSGFPVGAAVLEEGGGIVTGCNVESAGLSLSLCAERVALVKALSEGKRRFVAVATYSPASPSVTPCGACRQMIHELAPTAKVILITSEDAYRIVEIGDLLPEAFSFKPGLGNKD